MFGDKDADRELRNQISDRLRDARSQVPGAPVCLVLEKDFEYPTHALLNAAHLPLLNLLKDKPVLFDDDARLIIANLQGAVVCAAILGACMHFHVPWMRLCRARAPATGGVLGVDILWLTEHCLHRCSSVLQGRRSRGPRRC